jgi:hypothetical protein
MRYIRKNNKGSLIRRNRKGVLGSQLLDIAVSALVLLVCIYFIWSYLLHGASTNLEQLQSCGNVATGKGICKESCNPDDELGIVGVGCSGVKKTCCISTSTQFQDTILPSPYGGDDKTTNFAVTDIGLGTYDLTQIGNCKFDDPTYHTSLRCVQGTRVTLDVKIGLTGIGPHSLEAYASPVTTINDNQDSIKQVYDGTEKKTVTQNARTEVHAVIVISESNAASNSYWKIYPYAVCDTPECKSTDTVQGKGIMKNIQNGKTFLTIKFVDKLD